MCVCVFNFLSVAMLRYHSAVIDCLEILVSVMTCYVLIGKLHSIYKPYSFTSSVLVVCVHTSSWSAHLAPCFSRTVCAVTGIDTL